MEYRLGVDLGTTYTAAAIMRSGDPVIVPLGDHEAFMPSVVVLQRDLGFLAGEAAERRSVTAPGSTAREFKRRLGDSTPVILDGVPYSAHALMAKLLRWVLDRVSAREGGPPSAVVVSYPANWGEYRRDVLEQAIRQVGVEGVQFVTEPEAASVWYAAQERIVVGDVIGVYDLGGGTFDAAILRRGAEQFELLGRSAGVEQLGGVDIDEAVFAHVRRTIGEAPFDIDPDDDAVHAAVRQLRRDCTLAKEALSYDTDTAIPVNLPTVRTLVRLTRGELEDMIRPLLLETIAAFRRALASTGLAPTDLTAVLLAGGSSRIPLVAQLLSTDLDRDVSVDAHPKHIVALGAAMRAAGVRPAVNDPAPSRPDAGAVPAPKVVEPVSFDQVAFPDPAIPAGSVIPSSPRRQSGPRVQAGPPVQSGPPVQTGPGVQPGSHVQSDPPVQPGRPVQTGSRVPTGVPASRTPATGGGLGRLRSPGSGLAPALAAGLLGLGTLVPAVVGIGGIPEGGISVSTISAPAGDEVPLTEDLVLRKSGNALAGWEFTPSLGGIELSSQSVSGQGTVSVSSLRYVLAGPFTATVRRDASTPSLLAVIRPAGGLGTGGLLSIPGVIGIALLLFALAYAESFLRPLRRKGRASTGLLLGMGMVGATAGVGLSLIGWVLGDHVLTIGLILLCALTGLAAVLAGTVAVSVRGARTEGSGRPN